MPWFMAQMPSIQLAIVSDVLQEHGIASEAFEFYADFHDLFGVSLYREISSSNPYLADILFTRAYFDNPAPVASLPNFGLANDQFERDLFLFAEPLIAEFLDRVFAQTDWASFDAIAFSLTASQTGASMALAKRIRAAHPDLPIIFGGASCADEMGQALMEICPEVDIVVHKEAETVLPVLLDAMRGSIAYQAVPGISWRESGTIRSSADAPLHQLQRTRGVLRFDNYFARIEPLKTLSLKNVYIPFESSRGCWYGEKAQCTFCGLNEIIKYRQRGSMGLIDELQEYADRYDMKDFFAVDLIMPLSFFKTFLPELTEAKKDWNIFYEVKSNMKRAQIEQLADAGVNWIQPGIESLDDDVLKLMRKGVTSAQNIQTLRICRERDMKVGWSIINGFPREQAHSYRAMVELVPKLHHLQAPSNIGYFEVHRFSPFFDNPHAMGIEINGAHTLYEHVFPVEQSVRDRLVYRFDYTVIEPRDEALETATIALRKAVETWKRANARGADFLIAYHPGSGAILTDTRASEEPVVSKLDMDEALLMRRLDELSVQRRFVAGLERDDPGLVARLGGGEAVANLLRRWHEKSWVLIESGYVQTLAKVAARHFALNMEFDAA